MASWKESFSAYLQPRLFIILFLGKSGKEILNEASKNWKFDYEEKKSLTSNESLVVKISNLEKKNG